MLYQTKFSLALTQRETIYSEQTNLSGQPERWHGTESCPPHAYSPPTARLQVDQHKSTEDEGSPAQPFPVGVIKRTDT